MHFTSWREGGGICPLSCPVPTEGMAGKPQAVSENGSLAESHLRVPVLGCTAPAAIPQHLERLGCATGKQEAAGHSGCLQQGFTGLNCRKCTSVCLDVCSVWK